MTSFTPDIRILSRKVKILKNVTQIILPSSPPPAGGGWGQNAKKDNFL
jgi:hypothetical protein